MSDGGFVGEIKKEMRLYALKKAIVDFLKSIMGSR